VKARADALLRRKRRRLR